MDVQMRLFWHWFLRTSKRFSVLSADDFQLRQELIAMLPRLRRYALSLTGSLPDADDLVQDTCAKALRYSDQYHPHQDLDRWVFRIARNHWFSETRKRKVRLGAGQVDAVETGELYTTVNGENALAGRQLGQKIMQLPSELATVLLLVSVEGYSYKEAAAHLGWPIGTVMSRISRARQLLRERLTEKAPM